VTESFFVVMSDAIFRNSPSIEIGLEEIGSLKRVLA
jgi:hypothetical protein